VLLDRQREQEDVFERLDLPLLHETTELGARHPHILVVAAASTSASASASAITASAIAASAITASAFTTAAETAGESASIRHFSLCSARERSSQSQSHRPSITDRQPPSHARVHSPPPRARTTRELLHHPIPRPRASSDARARRDARSRSPRSRCRKALTPTIVASPPSRARRRSERRDGSATRAMRAHRAVASSGSHLESTLVRERVEKTERSARRAKGFERVSIEMNTDTRISARASRRFGCDGDRDGDYDVMHYRYTTHELYRFTIMTMWSGLGFGRRRRCPRDRRNCRRRRFSKSRRRRTTFAEDCSRRVNGRR